MNKHDQLLFAVDEKPAPVLTFGLALQHVLLILSGIIIVPVIVGKVGGVPPEQVEFVAFAALIVSAVSTLLQVLRFGRVRSG